MYDLQRIRDLYNQICLHNDMAAYQQLFTILETPLLGFMKALVGTEEVAEELYSDLFVKIWTKRDTLPSTDNPRNYIYTVARNLCLDYLKKEKHSYSIEF